MDIFDGIKNKLQHYESPMNQDEVWAELLVQKRARERSKKRRIIWLFLGCLFGLGGILYWVEHTQWTKHPFAQKNPVSNEIAITSDNSSTKERKKSILGNTPPDAGNSIIERQTQQNAAKSLSKHSFFSDKNTLLQKDYNTPTVATSQHTPSATGNQTISIAPPISPIQDIKTGTLLAASLAEKVDNSGTLLAASLAEKEDNSGTLLDASLAEKADNSCTLLAASLAEKADNSGTLLDASLAGNSVDKGTISYPLSARDVSTTTEINIVSVDKIQPLSAATLPFKISPLEKKIIIPMMAAEPRPNTKSKHFEIYAGTGIFSTQQRFSTQDNANKDYVSLRNETETSLTTFAFDAGVNYWFLEKNFMSIGVQHNSWYDRFNYTYEQPKDYAYENIVLRIIKNEQLGTEESEYGDTVVQGSETVKMTYFNKYVSTNLRLLLGRQIWSHKRLSFDLSGGMDWSVIASAKGNIAAPISTGGILDLQNTGGNTIYKKSLGIGLSGAMSVNYRLNQHWAIQFRPSATYFLSDAARANAFAEARFYRFGAMLGLRYRL